jgi:hypothetical protein
MVEMKVMNPTRLAEWQEEAADDAAIARALYNGRGYGRREWAREEAVWWQKMAAREYRACREQYQEMQTRGRGQ